MMNRTSTNRVLADGKSRMRDGIEHRTEARERPHQVSLRIADYSEWPIQIATRHNIFDQIMNLWSPFFPH